MTTFFLFLFIFNSKFYFNLTNLTFYFGEDTPSSHTGSIIDTKTHNYRFEIDLPKLNASYCGKQLHYIIASNRQPTPSAIKGNFQVFVFGE